MTALSPDRYLPNLRVRCVLLAAQEVLGNNGLNATLRIAGLHRFIGHLPPADDGVDMRASEFAAFIQAIETQYGSGARGQLHRIGHATFKKSLDSNAGRWNTLRLTNLLLPRALKMRRALTLLAAQITSPVGGVLVTTNDRLLVLSDPVSDSTVGRQRNVECCWLTLGEIQECLTWATGNVYEVNEVTCKAKGDAACTFEVGVKVG